VREGGSISAFPGRRNSLVPVFDKPLFPHCYFGGLAPRSMISLVSR